ncbi:uncharacterized protein GLRG_11586 [Colletotrichum graminicola M1.001]|uniref:Uncharacterized protein n=1 Tax=Colletotrichum graminicola (strain M1.001 / M2 / FGSC 10212) TaxID=645133 RepID=E3R003_COLGM|nr:uncharacterized protein GLRG_11586 [Colletotrichum graminicola M1.001]EFQ36441.1 hypothetical protein GLRG_11586 [Colletotrichum graminicola M1.001]
MTNNHPLDPDTLVSTTAYDFRYNGVQVWQCDGEGYGVPGKFCCESAREKTRCCSTPWALFGPLIPATLGNAAAVQTYDLSATSVSAKPTSAPAADATSSPTRASKSPATPGGADVSSPTGVSGTGNNDDRSGGQGGIGLAASVGLGIGFSVGGALLIFAGVIWWLRRQRLRGGAAELDDKSIAGRHDLGGGGGNLTRPGVESPADVGGGFDNYNGRGPGTFGRRPINSMGTLGTMGTLDTMGTVGSWGTSLYGVTADPEIVTRASSDCDGSPVGVLGHYQMGGVDGKETLVTPPPQQTRFSRQGR